MPESPGTVSMRPGAVSWSPLGQAVHLAVEHALDATFAVEHRHDVRELQAGNHPRAIEERDVGGARLVLRRRAFDDLVLERIRRAVEPDVPSDEAACLR